MIEASQRCRKRPDVAVLAGGAWGGATWYEDRLRRQAFETGHGRIHAGHIPSSVVRQAWPDFDAPFTCLSENCGVTEPLYAGIPTIAARVGGLPEVIDEVWGWFHRGRPTPGGSDRRIAANLPHYRTLARRGHER
jgi:hypothetical protein